MESPNRRLSLDTKPPVYPWQRNNPDYSLLKIEVEICQDKNGRVYSAHKPQTPEDLAVAQSLPLYGLESTSYSLILEGARTEALLDMILNMSQNPDFLDSLKSLSVEDRNLKLKEFGEKASTVISKIVSDIMYPCMMEAYEVVTRE